MGDEEREGLSLQPEVAHLRAKKERDDVEVPETRALADGLLEHSLGETTHRLLGKEPEADEEHEEQDEADGGKAHPQGAGRPGVSASARRRARTSRLDQWCAREVAGSGIGKTRAPFSS